MVPTLFRLTLQRLVHSNGQAEDHGQGEVYGIVLQHAWLDFSRPLLCWKARFRTLRGPGLCILQRCTPETHKAVYDSGYMERR